MAFDREDGSCECGGHAVKREGRHGLFYGCSNFPRCRNTEPLQHNRPPGSFLISGDELLENWARAELADKDWM